MPRYIKVTLQTYYIDMKTIRTMMILDMKLRVLLTIAILMLFCSYSIGQQKICYAVYTEEDQTITCYNDGLMD